MKVTIVMAMSINGIICLEDGNEDFLSNEGGQLVSRLALEAGSLIWGRNTYEKVQQDYGDSIGEDLKSLDKVVVSSDPNYQVADSYYLSHSPEAAIKLLESRGHHATAVVGGSQLNAAFLKAQLVDELVVNVEPVLIGQGLPLFAPMNLEIRAKLISFEPVNNDELLLRYKIIK